MFNVVDESDEYFSLWNDDDEELNTSNSLLFRYWQWLPLWQYSEDERSLSVIIWAKRRSNNWIYK